jgi:hypothetical protein
LNQNQPQHEAEAEANKAPANDAALLQLLQNNERIADRIKEIQSGELSSSYIK